LGSGEIGLCNDQERGREGGRETRRQGGRQEGRLGDREEGREAERKGGTSKLKHINNEEKTKCRSFGSHLPDY
jgi:hypothetical protein